MQSGSEERPKGIGKILRALQKARTGHGEAPSLSAAEAAPGPAVPTVNRAEPPERIADRHHDPDPHVVAFWEKGSEYAAQFRALRTKLLAPSSRRIPRVIVITSGSRGEGKTTTATNLAVTFAEGEQARVLIVDADVYRPAVHRMLGVQAAKGINHVLNRDMDLRGVLYRTTIPNLDVLPAAADRTAPCSETDFDAYGPELFRRLRGYYDYIFIDTPPAISTSHAAVIGRHSDGVILVVRAERTPRQVVQRALQELKAGGAEVIGCILTHMRHHIPRWLYRLLGTTPEHYYSYRRARPAENRSQAVSQNR